MKSNLEYLRVAKMSLINDYIMYLCSKIFAYKNLVNVIELKLV